MKQIQLVGVAQELIAPITELCEEIGISVGNAGVCLSLCEGDHMGLKGSADGAVITYRAKHEIFRAVTYLPAFLEKGAEVEERGKFQMLCFMGDCSRNAVYNIPTAKKMIRTLASMGYDSMMFYTEDTYELTDYRYFGTMRGRYTAEELKLLDDYADSFGIELIPCIQALAHLSTALRWPDFSGYTDTDDILMVGDDRTYAFVRTAIQHFKSCFRSRQINLGMDEAHALARGRYLKKNGCREPSEVMLEHLDRVMEICRELGMHPMIWSDMFFRMAHNTYYIREGWLPEDVIKKVPEGLELIYWDYYTMDRERFGHMLDCHAQFDNPVSFAGGAWKWYGFGAHNAFSLKSTEMQLDLCEERGMGRVIVTAWGDDGGEASQFSVLPSMLYFAERCYNDKSVMTSDWMNARALACFGASFDELMCFDLPDSLPETCVEAINSPRCPSKTLLYNDLLERFMDRHMNRENVTREYAERSKKLLEIAKTSKFGYALETLGKLTYAVSLKAEMGWRIYEAYQANDRDTLAKIAREEIPALSVALADFLETFRRQWYRENKTFGFSCHEIRLGGLMAKVESARLRLLGYLNGEYAEIEELKTAPIPYSPNSDGQYLAHIRWRPMNAPGIL